jgi:hypothetical protein
MYDYAVRTGTRESLITTKMGKLRRLPSQSKDSLPVVEVDPADVKVPSDLLKLKKMSLESKITLKDANKTLLLSTNISTFIMKSPERKYSYMTYIFLHVLYFIFSVIF